MRPALVCPTGCGSRTFTVLRKGAISTAIEVDEYDPNIINELDSIAEAGGLAYVSCECGHHWRSRREVLDGIAEHVESR